MNRKKIRNIALAALALAASACGKNGADDRTVPEYITVDASILSTRATTDGVSSIFEKGDGISVYAWTGSPETVSAKLVVDGVVNVLGDDAKWTPESLMLWQDMETPHYFIGVYPARKVTDFKADPYELDPADYEKSDLLVARNLVGLTATQNPVSLAFDHAMAKLNVNLTFRTQWSETPAVSAVTATAAKTCTIDYLAKTCAVGAQTGVDIPALATASKGYALSFSGLMIPQAGFRAVSVTIEGQTYTYTHSADIPLSEGRYTTLNLIVGRDRVELGSVSINDWQEGGKIDDGSAM